MISICIPIYNFNVLNLVKTLIVQGKEIKQPFEIILALMIIHQIFIKINAPIEEMDNIQFLCLTKILEGPKLETCLLIFQNMINYYLLIVIVVFPQIFLKNYLKITNFDVIYGGRKHHQIKPKKIMKN